MTAATPAAGRVVGRASEIAMLDDLLPGRGSRTGHAVAIAGEPGIGKSRLLAELTERADEDGRLVLEGRATEFERDFPFGVFVDALDDYLGSLDVRRLEQLGDERLAELAHAFPTLGHRAQPGGLGVERYRLSNQLDVASRDETATVITLGPLTRDETAELLGPTLSAGRVDVVYEQSGGNPFFAEQLARTSEPEETATAEAQKSSRSKRCRSRETARRVDLALVRVPPQSQTRAKGDRGAMQTAMPCDP